MPAKFGKKILEVLVSKRRKNLEGILLDEMLGEIPGLTKREVEFALSYLLEKKFIDRISYRHLPDSLALYKVTSGGIDELRANVNGINVQVNKNEGEIIVAENLSLK